jgi:hypothetical protein
MRHGKREKPGDGIKRLAFIPSPGFSLALY